MANTIQGLLTSLSNNRDTIRAKLIDMGITTDDGAVLTASAQLSKVAEAADNITVDKTTKTVSIPIGGSDTITKGYHTNNISVSCNTKTSAVTLTKDEIITNSEGDPTFDVDLGENTVATSITVPKIGLGTYTVPANQLYNSWDGSEGDLEVTASDIIDSDTSDDFHWEGLSKVIIPRPTIESANQSVDILSAGPDEDTTVSISAGYKSDSTIIIETIEVYNALAAI